MKQQNSDFRSITTIEEGTFYYLTTRAWFKNGIPCLVEKLTISAISLSILRNKYVVNTRDKWNGIMNKVSVEICTLFLYKKLSNIISIFS